MRLLAAILLVCGLGLGAIYLQTDGFTAFTTEAARRADVLRHPRVMPESPLRGSSGASTTLLGTLRSDGRVAIVNFVYTRCFSICLAMGSQFQQLQAQIQRRGLAGKIRLLSLSFDPADTPELLSRYERRMASDPTVWQSMGIEGAGPRRTLLDAFGIVVVPAAWGQYEHNAAYHIVTPDGQLVRIVDLDDTQSLLDYAMVQVAKEGRHP